MRLSLFLIALVSPFSVLAAEASPTGAEGFSQTIMMVGIFGIFYFLLIRPQTKRAKAHQQLLTQLTKGDEVVTSGGIIGKITDLNDQIVTLSIAEGVEIKVQKGAIGQALPKGTLKTV